MKQLIQSLCLLLCLSSSSCMHDDTSSAEISAPVPSVSQLAELDTKMIVEETVPIPTAPERVENREGIKERLKNKMAAGTPLVVHLMIPLCDNENQGIVPTSASLGDGLSLRTNLYWATRSGSKRFFTNHKDWNVLTSLKDPSDDVLERVVFERDYANCKVFLVADAYRGDRMEETVNDFLAALAGHKKESVVLEDGREVPVAAAADLLIFNGHNGMMDLIDVKEWMNTTTKRTDAIINACVSFDYFSNELELAGAYPLARTNTLLHPGAYVLTQFIDDWVTLVDEKQLCLNGGSAYCKVHDCGKGTKIYKSGW